MATPMLITPTMVEDHYHRWREMVRAVATRDGYLVTSAKLLPFYRDLVDRLIEDVWWTNSPVGAKHPVEFLMWDHDIPDDIFLIWTAESGAQTPHEFFGPTGFGRLTFRPISNDGIRSWDTATVPDEELKHVVDHLPETL